MKKSSYICTAKEGEVPEWSIGPHSKCGERATVPGVRIPLSPQDHEAKRYREIRYLLFFIPWHKFTCRQRYRKQKTRLAAFCAVGLARAPAASSRERR